MYNDEQLLPLNEYSKMAKEYTKALKNKGFVFVLLDGDCKELRQEALSAFARCEGLLFALGGFLGTGKLYAQTQKHIQIFCNMFDLQPDAPFACKVRDKTRCFLSFIAAECNLLCALSSLLLACDHQKEILAIIKERTATASSLFSIPDMFF